MFQSKLFQQAWEFPSNPAPESPRSSRTLFLPSEIKLCNPPQPLRLMICLTSRVTPKQVPRRKTTSKGTYSSTLGLCFPPFFLLIMHFGTCTMHRYDKEGIKSLLCVRGVSSEEFVCCLCVSVSGCTHGLKPHQSLYPDTPHIQCTHLSNETIWVDTSPDLPLSHLLYLLSLVP